MNSRVLLTTISLRNTSVKIHSDTYYNVTNKETPVCFISENNDLIIHCDGITCVEVYDLKGKKIAVFPEPSGKFYFNVNTDFTNRFYIIRWKTNAGFYSKRVVHSF